MIGGVGLLLKSNQGSNLKTGYLYFYIHFITEITCFYFLSFIIGDSFYLWLCPLIYDALAFVPQSLIGYISDKKKNINFGIVGTFLLIVALLLFGFNISGKYIALIFLSLGNACIHINGAKVTLNCSNGKLSHSAIFVAGGSFGVITGKLLAMINIHYMFIIFLCLSMIPFIMYAELLFKEYIDNNNEDLSNYNYHSTRINKGLIIFLAVFVVIVRGYMGYGIPTSWKKTVFQTVLLFITMGIGKALGGILSDKFGIKKIANISTLIAIPFLLFGDHYMVISLIGVMFFSMTMSITLAVLVSVLKRNQGLAFGLTTIGLFLGTFPIFIFKFTSFLTNSFVIVILSFVCFIMLNLILRGKENV